MRTDKLGTAERCMAGAEDGTLAFPEIVGTLAAAGFEGYLVDFRRGVGVYYHEDGDGVEVASRGGEVPVAGTFDVATVRAAIADAQAMVPGYNYAGFCDRVRGAGCAGYMVSLPGRRAVYFARSAEMHVEHFTPVP